MSSELLLGAVLYDPLTLPVARQTVTADMFEHSAHRLLWATACRLADDGVSATVVEVLDRLAREGKVDQLGDVSEVHALVSAASPSNVAHYAARVVEDHRGRLLYRAADVAKRRLADGAPVDEVLAGLQQAPGHAAGSGSWTPIELAGRLADYMAGGSETWPTGWPSLDDIWRPGPGTLTVITGIPGSGKSTLADQVLLRQVADGRKVAVWSPDQAHVEAHLHRLVWSWTGRPPNDMPPDRLDAVLTGWGDKVVLFDPSDATLDSVLARAAACRPDVLLVDPWNKLRHSYGDRRHDLYLQDALGRLTVFARTSGCAVWVVAHPTKMQRKHGAQATFEVPTVYDISGGAEWANQADVVVCLWRDTAGERADPCEVKVFVQKVRREEWGRLGRRVLRFDARTRGYSENVRTPA